MLYKKGQNRNADQEFMDIFGWNIFAFFGLSLFLSIGDLTL